MKPEMIIDVVVSCTTEELVPELEAYMKKAKDHGWEELIIGIKISSTGGPRKVHAHVELGAYRTRIKAAADGATRIYSLAIK